MKKSFIKYFIILIFIGLITSCASIVHGPYQIIDISSQPTGAKITIDGKDYGTTPNSVELRRMGRFVDEPAEKNEYAVKVEMDGYLPYEVKINRRLDGLFFGNILFGGLIGIIIDASNGSMYMLTPEQIDAQMAKTSAMNYNKIDDRIYIAVSLNIDPAWERIGTLEKTE